MGTFKVYDKRFVAAILLLACTTYSVAQQQCSSYGKAEMSQGFITAAMSALSPLGIGSCSDGSCTRALAPCPNSTCCLSNYGPTEGSSRCGCLSKNAYGTYTCSDPQLLSVDVDGCTDGSEPQNKFSLQLYPRSKGDCENLSSVNLIMTEQGNVGISLKAKFCVANADGPIRENKLPPSINNLLFGGDNDIVLEGDLSLGPAEFNPSLKKTSLGVDKLYSLFGAEQVGELILHHKLLMSSI